MVADDDQFITKDGKIFGYGTRNGPIDGKLKMLRRSADEALMRGGDGESEVVRVFVNMKDDDER